MQQSISNSSFATEFLNDPFIKDYETLTGFAWSFFVDMVEVAQ